INSPEEVAVALATLAEATPESEVKHRPALDKSGNPVVDRSTGEVKMLAYVTARFVQDRLDSIGAENWQSSFQVVNGGAICTISIKLGGEWISRADGGDPTQVEGFKGQLSDAFKRAAVQFGIGRDLYEERDAPRPYASAPARPAPARKTAAPASGFPAGRTDADGTPVDACPVHNLGWVHKSGISKNSNKPYSFWACPAPFPPGCKERPPEGWQPPSTGDTLTDIPF
ncbi:MAG: hypothetical protein KGR26_13975, partial [Cyanobacteria bacterium REEB65]|nr:hypothetical protein [Cyanobacteria bacterium REEB65]